MTRPSSRRVEWQPERGVDVFSADTVAAKIRMTVSGSLEVGLRSDRMYTTRDRHIVLETPASLVFQRGAGTVVVWSMDTTQRIVVQPIGLPLDSLDQAGVTGTTIAATRVAADAPVSLKVQRP